MRWARPAVGWRSDAVGVSGDDRVDLFRLAVSDLAVPGSDADPRFQPLVERLANADPDWLAAFLSWLRAVPGLHRAAIAGAVTAAGAWRGAGRPGGSKWSIRFPAVGGRATCSATRWTDDTAGARSHPQRFD